MAKLENPDLPAGAIVEEYENGGARRNDGVELRPASQNPWYVLATVAGEQTGERVDRDLHEKNRACWNAWVGQALSDEQKAGLIAKLDLEEEAFELSEAQRDQIKARFAEAFPDQSFEDVAPDPEATVDFQFTHFAHTVVLEK